MAKLKTIRPVKNEETGVVTELTTETEAPQDETITLPIGATVELTDKYSGYSSIVLDGSLINFVDNKAFLSVETADKLKELQIVK